MAMLFEGVLFEELGEFGDFGVCETRIGLANIEELIAIADGESVVREDGVALAVTVFDGGDDDIESGIGLLQLEPIATTATRRVGRVWKFGDDAFVSRG